jgi:NADH:ubiquinone oxidoreductase subunit H
MLFLGVFTNTFVLVAKVIAVCFVFVLIRATFPRYRYNMLMSIG